MNGRRSRRRGRGAGRALAAAASAVLALQGCGLEEIIVLNPPDWISTSIADQRFQLAIDGDNNEAEFRGIEIYYRFYDENDVPPVNLQTQGELATAGYLRLSSTADSSSLVEYPLIPVDIGERGDPSTITLDFSGLDDATPTQPLLSADSEAGGLVLPETEIRRGVVAVQADGFYKRFYHGTDADLGFDADDADIDHLNLDAGFQPVKIALYALSYGKVQLTTTVYSRAVPLYSIPIRIYVFP